MAQTFLSVLDVLTDKHVCATYVSILPARSIFTDAEATIAGLGTIRREMRSEISVSRTPGNTTGITVAKGGTPPTSSDKIFMVKDDTLTNADPFDRIRRISRVKWYSIPFVAGKTYIISMQSSALDPYLRLEDPSQKPIAEDDDSGGGLNARIEIVAKTSGIHKIFATSFNGGTGQFRIVVHVRDGTAAKNDPKIPPIGPKIPPIGPGQPPEGWVEVRSKTGTFSVWLPKDGKFSETENVVLLPGVGQVRISNISAVRADGTAFVASQVILPSTLKTKTTQARIDLVRDATFREFKGNVLNQQPTKVNGFSNAQEYLIQSGAVLARIRIFNAIRNHHRTVVIGAKNRIDAEDARIFENSFRKL